MSADPASAPADPRYITDPPPAPDRLAEPNDGPAEPGSGGSSLPTGSLADRVKTRRHALELEQNVTLDLPGYEGILAVELRLLSWAEGHKVASATGDETDEGLRMLYVCADSIRAAFVQFYDVGNDEKIAIDDTWYTLCQRADLPLVDGASDRVAMIALLTDNGVMSLWADYETWTLTRGRRIAEQVMRDFKKTR